MLTPRQSPRTRANRSVLLSIAVLASTACAHSPVEAPTPAACDGTVQASGDLPAAMVAQGLTRAVGSGDTWFIAPQWGTWSASVVPDGRGGYSLKLPLWTAMAQPPSVTVHQLDGPHIGSFSSTPTAAGLPGPLPATASFPSAGCWDITAKGTTGRATARVRVGGT